MIRRRLREFIYGRLPFISGSFPYYGTRVYFPRGSHVFALACRAGTYEHENLKLLLKLVEAGSTFFDVGANIGLMSIPILSAFPTAQVVSFEVSPGVLPFLNRTSKASGHGDRWVVVGEAVSNSIGIREFHQSPPGQDAFDSLRDTGRTDHTTVCDVATTTIDAVWQRLSKPDVSAMKIDVEGAEWEVLDGARSMLRTCHPFVLLEWTRPNLEAYGCDPESLIQFAAEEGYSAYSACGLFRVTDRASLALAMLIGEDMLLVPGGRCP